MLASRGQPASARTARRWGRLGAASMRRRPQTRRAVILAAALPLQSDEATMGRQPGDKLVAWLCQQQAIAAIALRATRRHMLGLQTPFQAVWLKMTQVIAALAITLLLGAAIVFRGLAGPAHLQDGIQDTLQTLGGALAGIDSDVPQTDRSAHAAGLRHAGDSCGQALL